MKILSQDGLMLEAEFDRASEAVGTIVICHAHPQMQGTMNSPLLLAIRDAVIANGWNALRFNYRGVGDSEGEFGDVVGEVSDALGALEYVADQFGRAPVVLIGWSFGGAIAFQAARRSEMVVGCVGIAPAVERVDLPSARELGLEVPLLVVCGGNDKVVSPESCRRWAEESGATYVEISAANHFFWAKYDAVTRVIVDWLEKEVV